MKKMNRASFLLLMTVLCLSTFAACLPAASEREPVASSSVAPTAQPAVPPSAPVPTAVSATQPLAEPISDGFHPLPTYKVGEIVSLGDYAIRVEQANLKSDQLTLDMYLENNSKRTVDLGWALQLRDIQGNYIPPVQNQRMAQADKELRENSSRTQINIYQLPPSESANEPDQTRQFNLLYAPAGWSGPVFVFELTPTLKEVSR